jgi:hypothetical protein
MSLLPRYQAGDNLLPRYQPSDNPIPEFLKAPPPPPPGIEGTLAERGERYGLFEHQARITQDLKCAMRRAQNWPKLADDMKESLDLIASKIARILNGDPNYVDSWHDISGYATLIEKRLTSKEIL